MARATTAAVFGLLTAATSCGSPCHEESYCRVFDALALCTAPTCVVQGATLNRQESTDSYASSTVEPAPGVSSTGEQLTVELQIDLRAYAEHRARLDTLVVEATPNDWASFSGLSALTVTASNSESACRPRIIGVNSEWVCNAEAAGDGTLSVELPPPYPPFRLRIFYAQSTCDSVHTVCPM